jgi:hypothetical protein
MPEAAPKVFVSSVYSEPAIPGSGKHFHIRRRIQEIAREEGIDAWLAEYKGHNDPSLPWTQIIDRCVNALIDSELFLSVLCERSGSRLALDSRHGSAVSSVFEIELFYASLRLKPSFFFIVRGYEPEPELRSLIQLLRLDDGGHWFVGSENDIDNEIRALFRAIVAGRNLPGLLPNFCDLIAPSRSFREIEKETHSEQLSLIGRFPPTDRSGYSPQRVGYLLDEAEKAESRTDQLSRLWMALRDLSRPDFESGDRQMTALWARLARQLPTVSAWLGLHGPLNLGVVAAYQTQNALRRLGSLSAAEFPFGPFASEFYSIGLNHAHYFWKRRRFAAAERLATHHAELHPDDPSGALSIRGHARLRLAALGEAWKAWSGLNDFREVCSLREKQGADKGSMGEALFNLGLAEYQLSRLTWRKQKPAIARMREGIANMETCLSPNTAGHLVSSQRKLADVLARLCYIDDSAEVRARATKLARQYGLLDQLRRL